MKTSTSMIITGAGVGLSGVSVAFDVGPHWLNMTVLAGALLLAWLFPYVMDFEIEREREICKNKMQDLDAEWRALARGSGHETQMPNSRP